MDNQQPSVYGESLTKVQRLEWTT